MFTINKINDWAEWNWNNMLKVSRLLMGVLLSTVLFPQAPPHAQLGGAQGVSPGSILQHDKQPQTQSQWTETKPNAPEKSKDPDLTPGLTPGPAQEKSKVLAPNGQKIFLKSIELKKSTLLDPAQVRSMIAPYENRENPFQDLEKLSKDLTDLYYQKGYYTSRVIIPPGNSGR